MKRNLRKFLSLLMVFALLCGMVPAAFAASASDISWEGEYGELCWVRTYEAGEYKSHVPVRTDSEYGYDVYECLYCGEIGYSETDGYYGHNHTYTKIDEYEHWVECDYRSCEYYYPVREAHNAYCDCDGTTDHDHRYKYIDSIYHEVECFSHRDCEYWEPQYERHTGTNCVCQGYTSDSDLILTTDDNLSGNNTYTANDTRVWVEVKAALASTVTGTYDFKFEWTGDYAGTATTTTASSYIYLDTSRSSCDVSCTVTATNTADSTDKLTGTVSWHATAGSAIEVSATIFNTNTGYALGSVDDEGYTSVEEQIYDAVYSLGSINDDYILDYVVFDDVDVTGGYLYASTRENYYYDYDLGEVVFYPTDGYVGKAVFPFTAYYYDDYYYGSSSRLSATGTLTFDVKEGNNGLGIVYTAIAGEAVDLDETDFVEFWEEVYPYGTLDSVSFSVSSSKGSIYDAYGTAYSKRATGSCYYDPTGNQTGLSDLTFVPKSSTATGAVEITFTAKGTKTYSSSVNNGTATGTITILYTAKEVTPIEYLSTGNVITLDADDFLAKYKEVMEAKTATANSLSIQFLEAPTYGSLYLNYNSSSYFNNGTELTDSNILNYTFSGNKNATRSIEDVTYVPGTYSAAGESLRFACYYGSALKFVGTVNFGATDPIAVEYVTSGTTPVTFSAYDFLNASMTSGYLYFGTPSYGTLYRNYANGTGTRVNTYDSFSTSTVSYGSTYSLNTLTYVPAAGYVGVVEIPIYSTYSLLGTQTKGVVKIYVGRSFTDIAGTSHVWAQPYIDKLSAQNIIKGTGDGTTYSPGMQLTYGEALTLIMRAVGYPEQAKTGTHWASGFLTRAYYDGLVSSSTIDLNSKVNRDTIATITAKALGLSSASSVNWGITGPSDSANGYVYALYNAGILSGVNQNGKNYYLGSNYITRAEISKIICLVADYEA